MESDNIIIENISDQKNDSEHELINNLDNISMSDQKNDSEDELTDNLDNISISNQKNDSERDHGLINNLDNISISDSSLISEIGYRDNDQDSELNNNDQDSDKLQNFNNFIDNTKPKSVHFNEKKLSDPSTIKFIYDQLDLELIPESYDITDMITCHIDAGVNINDINTVRINEIMSEINKYVIIGRKEIGKNLYKGLNEYDIVWLYFIVYNNEQILIGSETIPAFLWYKFDEIQFAVEYIIKDCQKIINNSNPLSYQNKGSFDNRKKALIINANDGIDIDDLERYFIFNSNFEHLTWGSAWTDYPFRDQVINNEMTIIDLAKLAYYSLRQNPNEVANTIITCRTKITKSLVSFEEYSGVIIAVIEYNSMPVNRGINKLTNHYYPTDLPHDVLLPLLNFRYIIYQSILNIGNLTIENIRMAFILSTSDEEDKRIYKELNNKNIKNINVKEYINSILNTNISNEKNVI